MTETRNEPVEVPASADAPGRFERMKVEVVSGGTQRDTDPEAPEPMTMFLGIAAWIGLFVVLALVSPWTLVFVVGLVLSVILHEFGHFWTARRSGMKVTQFFVGFGPRVWSFHHNGVEYGLRALPLGGFVKIIGMTNMDEVAEEDEAVTYRQASYPKRMWVITAGSVMHMILAVGLITSVYAVWGQVRESGRVTIREVVADSPAQAAGFEGGDIVLSVDGTAVADRDAFTTILAAAQPGSTHEFVVQRDGSELSLSATLVQHPDVTDKVQGFLGVRSSSEERLPTGNVVDAFKDGTQDLFVGMGQAVVGVSKVINPVNVWGHLVGTNDDITSRPGTVVGAAKLSDDVGKYDGWAGMLGFLALVNLSIGVFNMFPLLPLDGGHAAIATYERLRSRKGRRYYADVAKLMPVAAICIMLLAFMFLTGLYLDTAGGG
ncbi:MAG: site-2 protease family protein [Ilumatobacter sp.]|nr:site-2 protease family protein [Ilumatobacter sp.]